MKWKKIETAPEDGTWVLLTGGDPLDCALPDRIDVRETADQKCVTAYFNGGEWMYAYWDTGWRSAYANPTHWMPLPPPPEADA